MCDPDQRRTRYCASYRRQCVLVVGCLHIPRKQRQRKDRQVQQVQHLPYEWQQHWPGQRQSQKQHYQLQRPSRMRLIHVSKNISFQWYHTYGWSPWRRLSQMHRCPKQQHRRRERWRFEKRGRDWRCSSERSRSTSEWLRQCRHPGRISQRTPWSLQLGKS